MPKVDPENFTYDKFRGVTTPVTLLLDTGLGLLVIFEGSWQIATSRPLRRFWRSVRQKTSFRARMRLVGVQKTKLYILTPIWAVQQWVRPIIRRYTSLRLLYSHSFAKNANFRLIFDGTYRNFQLKMGFNAGTSSVNTPKTTRYACGSWMMNRQIKMWG